MVLCDPRYWDHSIWWYAISGTGIMALCDIQYCLAYMTGDAALLRSIWCYAMSGTGSIAYGAMRCP
eukprot:760091-Rhodomonas_salina.1